MAVKRKARKMRINSAVRHPQTARLKPRHSDHTAEHNSPDALAELPNELFDSAALPENEASGVMLVITIASLLFIGFIAWCVAQMPAK